VSAGRTTVSHLTAESLIQCVAAHGESPSRITGGATCRRRRRRHQSQMAPLSRTRTEVQGYVNPERTRRADGMHTRT
jgi:hypothetical protein